MLKILHRIVVVLLALTSVLAICCWLEIWNPLSNLRAQLYSVHPGFIDFYTEGDSFNVSYIADGQFLFLKCGWLIDRPAITNGNTLFDCGLDCAGILYNESKSRYSTTQPAEGRAFLVVVASYWLIALITGLYPFIFIVKLVCRMKRASQAMIPCRNCHYDLTGNQSGTCPECGTTIDESNTVPKNAPTGAARK